VQGFPIDIELEYSNMRFDIDLTNLVAGEHLSGLPERPRTHWNGPGLSASLDGQGELAGNRDILLIVTGKARLPGATAHLSATQLLERYKSTGTGFFEGLHGHYAIAVIDAPRRQVILCNDRMAVGNWCYRTNGQQISFSDRADTIGLPSEISKQALLTYLFQHVIPSPETVYHDVARLPPAHCLVFTAKGSKLSPHWTPVFSEPGRADYAALKEEFKRLIEASVARATADSPSGSIATFLSGGTDSSTVSGMLRKVTGAATRAYSIGFDVDGYDEMEYARIAARHFGIDHREYYLSPDDVRTGMPKVATHYDQPFGNSSAVAAFHCARVAREEGVATLLAGDGGDELFGGNARYAKQRIFGWYENIPGLFRHYAMEPMLAENKVCERIPVISKAASYVQQARVPMPDRLNMYNLLLRLGLNEVLTPAFLEQTDSALIQQGQRAVYNACGSPYLINKMLAFDWKYTLADNDLPKVIGTTQLAGIGVGFPLLADELIDFSLRLPAEYKLKGLQLRWFFKEALRDFLPEQIIVKKKQGFGLPFGVWALRHEALRQLVDEALGSFGRRGVIREDFIRRLKNDLLPAYPGYYGELAWIVTMLEFWLQEKAPGFGIAD
jgi:asparagine synthase (glutamine-hydrolysing)